MFSWWKVLLLFFYFDQIECQTTPACQACISILPLAGGTSGDGLVGDYRLTEDRGCPEGCSYTKDNADESQTWCFKPGHYPFEHVCPATETTQEISTEIPPPATPSPTSRFRVQYEEDGEIFEQENTYNNVTGEAKLTVPAHGNNSALEVIMQESTGILVTAGDHVCQVSSVPDDVNTAAIQDVGEEVAAANITVTNGDESIRYELKISDGELTEEEKGDLTESMKNACGNKPIEKIKIKSTDEDTFSRMANGEIVAISTSNSKKREATCTNLTTLCTSINGYCWRWPYSSNYISVHYLGLNTICVTCCNSEQNSKYCKCEDINNQTKLSECYAITHGNCALGTYKCNSTDRCQTFDQLCDGKCHGGNIKCGNICIYKEDEQKVDGTYTYNYEKRECTINGVTTCLSNKYPCNGCDFGMFKCGKKCYPDWYRRYGYRDCDGQCVGRFSQCNGTCADGSFPCGPKGCRPEWYRRFGYRECDGQCITGYSQCNGTCAEGYFPCGTKSCRPEKYRSYYRDCNGTCIYETQQCNGECLEGYKACGTYRCIPESSYQDYFLCGKWCIYKSDWSSYYFRSCGDTCLYRYNFDKFYECSNKQCNQNTQPCNGTCPGGRVLCQNQCYDEVNTIPSQCLTTTTAHTTPRPTTTAHTTPRPTAATPPAATPPASTPYTATTT